MIPSQGKDRAGSHAVPLLFSSLTPLFLLLLCTSSQAAERTWQDATGKFQVEATFVELAGESVVLRRRDGVKLTVPLSLLSEADREFVASLNKLPAGAPAAIEQRRALIEKLAAQKRKEKLAQKKKIKGLTAEVTRLARRNIRVRQAGVSGDNLDAMFRMEAEEEEARKQLATAQRQFREINASVDRQMHRFFQEHPVADGMVVQVREALLKDLKETQLDGSIASLKETLAKLKRSRETIEQSMQRMPRQVTVGSAGGFPITRTNPALKKLSDRRRAIVQQQTELDEQLKDESFQYEQNRRWILFTHKLTGDAAIYERDGMILDEKEIAQVRQAEAKAAELRGALPTPKAAADLHVKSLAKQGIIENATYIGLIANPYLPAGNPRNKNAMLVRYSFAYVSRGGLRLERTGGIIVEKQKGGFWYPSAEMQLVRIVWENLP